MIDDYEKRHHRFEGCFNFRDIGGYAVADGRVVRWGRYFRGGRQDRMTAGDLETLEALGIRTQVDLRRPGEIHDQGRGPLAARGADYHNLAVIPEGGTDRLSQMVGDTAISGRRYLGYLELGSDCWVRLFELFADAERHPILVHCTAGKDRTGVATAFLLSVLGVDRAVIEADYAMSNRDVPRHVDFLEQQMALPEGMDRETLVRFAGIPEEAMGEFLDGLDARWGGPLEYLRSIGIDDTTMESVRRAFLKHPEAAY